MSRKLATKCNHGLPPLQCAYCSKRTKGKIGGRRSVGDPWSGFKRPLSWWIRFGQIEKELRGEAEVDVANLPKRKHSKRPGNP